MTPLIALLDASVLYPAPLRDLLVRLSLVGLFDARWTETIHDEWIRNVSADRPDLSLASLQRARALMDTNIRDCLVTGYEEYIPTLILPDPDDRHVLAAAIRGRAEVIVTANLRHFPLPVLAQYGIRPQHPDAFIGDLLDRDISQVVEAVHRQRAGLRNPLYTAAELLDTLGRQGLTQTVARLRSLADQI
jgi:predicted nucleic acid-binding protein